MPLKSPEEVSRIVTDIAVDKKQPYFTERSTTTTFGRLVNDGLQQASNQELNIYPDLIWPKAAETEEEALECLRK